MLSWFANCIVPAKLGDAYRAYLLKRERGVSFSATIGTILAERIIDVLVLFLLMLAATSFAFGRALPSEVAAVDAGRLGAGRGRGAGAGRAAAICGR